MRMMAFTPGRWSCAVLVVVVLALGATPVSSVNPLLANLTASLPALAEGDLETADYQGERVFGDGFRFLWSVYDVGVPGGRTLPTKVIECAIEATTAGWAGIGFNSEEETGMTNGDFYICTVAPTVDVSDGYGFANDDPDIDSGLSGSGGEDSVIEQTGSVRNGIMTCRWRREIDTLDPFDYALKDEFVQLLYASGPGSQRSSVLKHSFVGALAINVFDPSAGLLISPALLHGITMGAAWLVMWPTGVYLARFMKSMGKLWFQLHTSIQSLLALTTLASGYLIYVNTSADTISIHGMIGVFVIATGAIMNPLLGILADRRYDPEREEVPEYPDKYHWYLGRASFLAGIVNIGLGLQQPQIGAGIVPTIILVLYVVILAVFFTFSDLRMTAKEEELEEIEMKSEPGLIRGGSRRLTSKPVKSVGMLREEIQRLNNPPEPKSAMKSGGNKEPEKKQHRERKGPQNLDRTVFDSDDSGSEKDESEWEAGKASLATAKVPRLPLRETERRRRDAPDEDYYPQNVEAEWFAVSGNQGNDLGEASKKVFDSDDEDNAPPQAPGNSNNSTDAGHGAAPSRPRKASGGKRSGGKRSGGKRSGGKRSDGRRSDGRRSDGKRSGGKRNRKGSDGKRRDN